MGFNVPPEEYQRWVREGLVRPDPGPGATRPAKRERVTLVEPLFVAPGTWVLPLHLEPVTNNGAIKRQMIGRAGKHRRAVARAFAGCLGDLVPFAKAAQARHPVECRLVRLARGQMDDDNLKITAKWVRDTVAMFLGVDDGPKGPVVWSYCQERSQRCGLRIELRLPKLSPGGP
jgi:hypothetical protein